MPRENPSKRSPENAQRDLFDFTESPEEANTLKMARPSLESLPTDELEAKFRYYLDISPSGLTKIEIVALLQMPKDDALAYVRLKQAEEDKEDIKDTYRH